MKKPPTKRQAKPKNTTRTRVPASVPDPAPAPKNTHRKSMLSATNARRDFFKLIEMAQQPGRQITITVDGEPKVTMLSYDDYEGLIETLEIMSDPEAVKGIKEGLDDLKHGRMRKWEDVKKELNLP